MIKPTIEDVRKNGEGFDIVPVYKEIFSDIKTPIEVLRAIKEHSDRYYLLESAPGGEAWSRYSFLGYDPILQISCKDNHITVTGECEKHYDSDAPYEEVRKLLAQYRSYRDAALPPFTGGFVGYFAYDCIKYAEPSLKFTSADEAGFKDFDLMLFDKVIAFDNLKQKIFIITNVRTNDVENSYQKAQVSIEKTAVIVKKHITAVTPPLKLETQIRPNDTKEAFIGMVAAAKQHIFDGDIFQAVLSRRFTARATGSLFNTYRVLRTVNPSPYMIFMKADDVEIAGASPETLIKLANGRLFTFPIAGTRKRGETVSEDDEFETELLRDEKELAEHNMLVDLGRNDIGRISEFGSVKVEEYASILRFSHVMHIASTVTGDLKSGKDSIDAVFSLLPAGTLSGAPKIKACEIIDRLEGCRRGIYGGAIGYIDFSGNMDMCIGIRIAVKKGDTLYIQAGAGIVADSDPESEYGECANKTAAMLRAVELSGKEIE